MYEMSTFKDFKQYQARLQSEFITESNDITEFFNSKNNEALDVYNSTIAQNKKQYDAAIANLRSQYNKMLKRLQTLIDSYNLSLLQLNSVSDINISNRLQTTMWLTEIMIPDISLCLTLESIEKPAYLYKFNLSESLSKILIPDIRPDPDGNYILTINSDHVSQSDVLTINSQMTTTKYYYCVAEPLDILIIYTHTYSDHIAYAYFVKISTMEYLPDTTLIVNAYMFLDNKIVAYIQCYEDDYWRFDYYTFNLDDLSYTIFSSTHKKYLEHFEDDTQVYPIPEYDAILYINENNLYRAVLSNNEIKEQFIMTIDLPFTYHNIEIVSFKGNILILRTVAHRGQFGEYKQIYVPDSILYKYLY